MQAVGVDGRLSKLVSVLSGVPQGTVLGPCLFLIHLLDIANNISDETRVASFADDEESHQKRTVLLCKRTLTTPTAGQIRLE